MSQIDMYTRGSNGVRRRADGRGDGWANGHREQLGNRDYIQDVDALFGMHVFGSNTGERLFLEYEPDSYENRGGSIRSFAVIAMFDRKSSEQAAFCAQNSVSLALYLWICRIFAEHQPIAPRFFVVLGGDTPPWCMVELSITTGDEIGDREWISGSDWGAVWNKLGLRTMRSELRKWINGSAG